mgnify:CR=1 FL=1
MQKLILFTLVSIQNIKLKEQTLNHCVAISIKLVFTSEAQTKMAKPNLGNIYDFWLVRF